MRWIELLAAALAAALGWVGIGLYLLGPRLGGATGSLEPGGAAAATTAQCSLLEAGVPVAAAVLLLLAASGFALVLLGAWLHARDRRNARWLVAAGAMVPAAIVLVAWNAAPYVLPGAAVATVTAALAWAPTTATRRR